LRGSTYVMTTGQRRLAAIMVTDMVGFSAIAQADEARAMKLLQTHQRMLRPVVNDFLGKEIKTLGDGFLIEFESALNATRCAIDIQKTHRDYNLSSAGNQFAVRIGIHIGDVIHQEGDVFGDAVNVAARVEPLADPGGICVTEQVFAEVRNKIEYPMSKLPPQRLKNIEVPFDIYKVVLPWDSTQIPSVEPGAQSQRARAASFTRISSGVESLDREIGGGLPEGTVTLIYGAPKTGKSVFAYHFLMESVRRNTPCLFIMTDYTADQLSLALSTFGWDIADARQKGEVRLVDMTSTVSEKHQEDSARLLKFASIADLTDLAQSMKELGIPSKEAAGFRVVLDSLTPLFIYNPPLIVAKFLRQFALRTKGAGAGGVVVTYVDGAIDPQSELIIKSSVDNLVCLRDKELFVEGMLGSPRVRMAYKITDGGMRVGF
jgi:class 3 adenylate cyclase/KaiC/GvpD/RAD55 family RecA-like ATPase